MSKAQLVSVTDGQLRLVGAVDYDSAPFLAIQFSHYLHTKQPVLSLDMSEVTHINSAGMALLINCFKKAKKKGIVLQFCSVPPQLARIATLTRVDTILNLPQESI